MSTNPPLRIRKLIKQTEKFVGKNYFGDLREVRNEFPISELDRLVDYDRKAAVITMFERMGTLADWIRAGNRPVAWQGAQWTNFHSYLGYWYSWCSVLSMLLSRDCEFSAGDWDNVLTQLAKFRRMDLFTHNYLPKLARKLDRWLDDDRLNRSSISALRKIVVAFGRHRTASEGRLCVTILNLIRKNTASNAKQRGVRLWFALKEFLAASVLFPQSKLLSGDYPFKGSIQGMTYAERHDFVVLCLMQSKKLSLGQDKPVRSDKVSPTQNKYLLLNAAIAANFARVRSYSDGEWVLLTDWIRHRYHARHWRVDIDRLLKMLTANGISETPPGVRKLLNYGLREERQSMRPDREWISHVYAVLKR